MKKSRKDDVVNTANCIIRKVGYSNLSFTQIAKTLGVTRENVHHYFKKKELLGNACLDLMAKDLNEKFKTIIQAELSSKEKLKAYFKIYKTQQNEKEDCPIVSLLSEYELLPESMKIQVKELANIEQNNMEKILQEGRNKHAFSMNKEVSEEARLIITLLKGAVGYAKINDDFNKITDFILMSLETSSDIK
jgi:TetR/AcrR family transcriptional repressor of nem operon